jgi:DNA-binding response OmpR family regulator
MAEETGGLTVRVLLIEDNRADAEMLRVMLSEDDTRFVLANAVYLKDALRLLKEDSYDIIVLDLNLPDSEGPGTFDAVRAQNPSTPIIILTGLADKQFGLESVKKGAQDYLVKGEFDGDLLVRSISYSIERQKLLIKLENTLKELRVLKGLLPICSSCKRIRDDKGYWTQIEAYISEHSEAEFTHGLCPECAKKYFEEYEKMKDRMKRGASE